MASPSLNDFNSLLSRSRLLPRDDLPGLTKRWRAEGQAGAGLGGMLVIAITVWLIMGTLLK